MLYNTKEMSSLGLIDGKSEGNIMGCFGTILARSWYMADDPPSHSDLGAQLEWLSLLLSDRNRVRAAGLYATYYQHRSQVTEDKFALEALEQQHYSLQCRVTPIHRLPAEAMIEIFYMTLDIGQVREVLMQTCWRWFKIIEGMASVWSSLHLGAGTTPENVHHFLSRAGTHPLAVEINIDKAGSMEERLKLSFAMIGSKASQWQTLTIAALPRDEPDAQSNNAFLSAQLQPMRQLRHLNITEPVLSPLLMLLLQNVTTTAMGKLTSMEIHSFSAVQYLLQPAHSSICCSLTKFIAKVPKMDQPFDLLPYFMQLEVLELTNLPLLPIVDNGSPLPLASTLRHLYLKSVSIQWMGGQVFSHLENCTISAPPTYSSFHHDVQLPACTELHFENWNISPIGRFFAPALDHLRVKGDVWSPYKGNGQVAHLVRAGFGMGLQPKSLSLSVPCTGKALLVVLQLLPELVELKLDLSRPSALGEHFFTRLLAKPENQLADKPKFDWRELFREHSTGWRCAVCPSLRTLELKYRKWLRPGYNDEFLPPLLALSWSREKTETALQSHVHYKTSAHSWESLNSTLSQVNEALSCFRIPQHGHVSQLSLKTKSWTIFEDAHLIPFLHRLQVLEITSSSFYERQVLNVLPSFHELRDLKLSRVHIPPLDVDLPLVHTLQKLSLANSTLAWMDGLVFTQLQRFAVNEYGWPETFRRKVGMPACTHIVFEQNKLEALPALQSNFHFPRLNTCILPSIWNDFQYDERGISALQRIHAKVFKFFIGYNHLRLLELLESKDEIEQLDLSFSYSVLTCFPMAKLVTREFRCPDIKMLRFQFLDLADAKRKHVVRTCMPTMEKGGSADYHLETPYMWWHHDDWETAASLVWIMENETARIEGWAFPSQPLLPHYTPLQWERVYDRPGKKPAARFQPDPLKLDAHCQQAKGRPFAMDWIVPNFAHGVTTEALLRVLGRKEINEMDFPGGFEPQQAYDGLISKVGEHYECGPCKEGDEIPWKNKKNGLRRARDLPYGPADFYIPGEPNDYTFL